MTIKIKIGDVYADPADIKVKVSGAYQAPVVYTKVDGTYQNVTDQLLRFATALNKMANTSQSAGGAELRYAARLYRPIGSTNYRSLRIRADNCYLHASGQIFNGGTPLNIVGVYIECNGVSVPVTWTGSLTASIGAGLFDIVSDAVLPSAFGLSSFTQNTITYIRVESYVPSGGQMPIATREEGDSTAVYYNPANSTLDNLSGTGPLAFTGTGRTNTGEMPLYVIGEQVNTAADARVWLGYGDSLFANYQSGYFRLACTGNRTSWIAGCDCAVVNGTYASINLGANAIGSLMKYANGLVDEMNTNSIASSSLAQLQSYAQQIWAFWRTKVSTSPQARPLIIVRSPLGMYTTGTFNTLVGQTINGANWDAAGSVEQFNDWLPSQVGLPTGIDYLASTLFESSNLIRGSSTGKGTTGSDWYRWGVAGGARTSDGLHPSQFGASGTAGLGANLRTHLLLPENM